MAAFVRVFAQKVAAEICPAEPLVSTLSTVLFIIFRLTFLGFTLELHILNRTNSSSTAQVDLV